MTGFGLIQDEIARWLDIDDKTLRKHFRRELDTGAIEANTRVAASLYAMATKDKIPAAAIFWMKARAGWKDHNPEPPRDDAPRVIEFVWQPATPPKAINADTHTVTIDADGATEFAWQDDEQREG
jgi:hypothetical protein